MCDMKNAMQELDEVRDKLSGGAYLTLADALKAKFDDVESKTPIVSNGYIPFSFCSTSLERYTYKSLAQVLRMGCVATTPAERDVLEPMVHKMATYLTEGALSTAMAEVTEHLNEYKNNYPKFHDVLHQIMELGGPPQRGQLADFAAADGEVIKVDLGEWWEYHKERIYEQIVQAQTKDDEEDEEDDEEEAARGESAAAKRPKRS